jgi:hypothetical protein
MNRSAGAFHDGYDPGVRLDAPPENKDCEIPAAHVEPVFARQ